MGKTGAYSFNWQMGAACAMNGYRKEWQNSIGMELGFLTLCCWLQIAWKGEKRQSRMDFALDTIEAMTFKDKIIEVCLGAEGWEKPCENTSLQLRTALGR